MADDVLLNKASAIERCLTRIREEYLGHETTLATDFTRQDSIVLNLQRACEASIDLAMHVSRKQSFDLPQDARDAFTLLKKAGAIPQDVANHMRAMGAATWLSINIRTSACTQCLQGRAGEELLLISILPLRSSPIPSRYV